MKEARAEHARLLKEAQEEIARERERAVADIRNEVVALSIAAARQGHRPEPGRQGQRQACQRLYQ